MGVRGELFSTRVLLPNRTYFFNIKENRIGDLYLNIVESKNKEGGGFDRQSVILFADDLQEFLKGFDESLRVLEKAVREKRRTGSTTGAVRQRTGDSRFPSESDNRERTGWGERSGHAGARQTEAHSERVRPERTRPERARPEWTRPERNSSERARPERNSPERSGSERPRKNRPPKERRRIVVKKDD
jgi:hypothetical protein